VTRRSSLLTLARFAAREVACLARLALDAEVTLVAAGGVEVDPAAEAAPGTAIHVVVAGLVVVGLEVEGAEAVVVLGEVCAVVVVATMAEEMERVLWSFTLRSTPKVAIKPTTSTTAIPMVTGDRSRSRDRSGRIRGIWISP